MPRPNSDRFWIDTPKVSPLAAVDDEDENVVGGPDIRDDRDAALLALNDRIDQLESRHRKDQETIERQAMLIDYLESANEELSRRIAQLLVEVTRAQMRMRPERNVA